VAIGDDYLGRAKDSFEPQRPFDQCFARSITVQVQRHARLKAAA